MDYSSENQQYQQYYQQYQQQPQTAEAYDPSQMQSYYVYNQQPQEYHYYPSQDYASTSYPQKYYQEPTSIHPPGVPIPSESTHLQNQQNAYYSHGVVDNSSQQQSNLTRFAGNIGLVPRSMQAPIGQSANRGRGRKAGRPFRGSGRGHGHRPGGRGLGQGGGRHLTPHGTASNSAPTAPVPGRTSSTVPAQVPAAPSWPPPRMAWCELCRVDCNTPEILEQHKNGKRHKKNLQTHAELQNLNKLITGQQNVQAVNSGSQPEVLPPEKVEGSGEKQPQQDGLPCQSHTENNRNEAELPKNTVDEPVVNTVDSAQEPQKKSRGQYDARGRGFKRKMRGGRGGKYMRTNEGPRRQVEPPKPKEVIPFICELCNVKCESQVVFDSHLAGKKHQANVKRFHGHRALYGEAGLQALYPPNFNNPSSSVNPQVQQGVNDPQLVLAQLLTYVVSQAQASGLLAAQLPGLLAAHVPGVEATVAPAPAAGSSQETHYELNNQTQGSMAVSEAGSKKTVMVETEGQQQSITTVSETPVAVSIDTKAENGSSASEGKDASLPQENVVIASSDKPDKTAEQIFSATASEKASPTIECEIALSDQPIEPGIGNGPDDLESEEQDPGLENEEDEESEYEEDPEEDPQLQNEEQSNKENV